LWFYLSGHGFVVSADQLITRSALVKTLGGIVNRICFAVFRLITSSNLAGCSTGKSAGLARFKILASEDERPLTRRVGETGTPQGARFWLPADVRRLISTIFFEFDRLAA
jgi:hypothetical protein